ncbi:hypothetical protein CVT24_012329 [Panaeolus cyanescens]|uniref:Cytochrome P450 n=1 Tax=Panaeolus cyanescens TaxID=181874 RepID=A0A409YJ32_9AGAR|nr:hypothetical protein CVT24_012329 [Panaeolus cyanescens]
MLPPGPRYIITFLPHILAPSFAIGAGLFLAKQYEAHNLPVWAMVTISFLAQPVVFFIKNKWDRLADARAAKARGAVLPPLVKESALAAISKMTDSIKVGYPGDVFYEWLKQHGKNYYQLNVFGAKMLFTTEPDHVKQILATQFESFEKGMLFCNQMDSLLGEGIFNSDGEMWKFHRAITRPFFTKERISDFDIYTRNCDKSLEEARKRLKEGYPLDIQDLIGRFTLDSASEFLFGHNVDSLSAGLPYPKSASVKNTESFYNHPSIKFQHAFNEGQLLASIRSTAGEEWRLIEFWKDEVDPLRKHMDEFTEPMMRQALEARERRSKNTELEDKDDGNNTLLAHLVNHTQDPKILKDELINLLVAGRDTTMALLTFSVYMLIEHPDVERKLRDEILEKVGAQGYPTYQNMRDMKYTRAFLNEVLRLYPSVPLDNRETNKPVVLTMKGSDEPPLYLPKGTTALYSVLHMHRRTDLWGPDALQFDPDRFLDERLHKYLTPNPFIFCPFNAGPRICLGQQFAYHEATFYLVRLLQKFTNFQLAEGENICVPESWKNADGLQATDKIVPTVTLTMSVKPETSNEMLPPGLRYILTVLPRLIAPSLAIGAGLIATKTHLNAHDLPTWSIFLVSVLAHPLISYTRSQLDRLSDKRAARANDAVLPPLLKESTLSIVSKLMKSISSGYPGDAFAAWTKEYGTNYLQMNFFSVKLLYTTEPDHVKAILATQFESFDKGPMFSDQMDSLLGEGIFNADGEMWKFHRAITRPFFTKERISDFDIYTRNCDKSLDEVRKRLGEGYSVDIQDMIGRFTLDSASEFLFGHNVGSLSAGIPYPSSASHKNTDSFYNHPSIKFQRAFNKGQYLASIRTGAGEKWRLFEFWKDTVEPLRKVMDSFTEPMMREALEARERRLNNPELGEKNEENTLLSHLVNHTQDPKILKDELINLLVAGRDTTMSLLTFGIHMLIQHPELEHKLRREIFEKVGPRNYPTYENMRDMKYTRAFLNEVLRLYPSVPLDTRITNKPVVLTSKKSAEPPIYLPAGTTAVYSVLYMHRRTDLWGPDALKFDPDRFIDERLHKYLTPNPFIFCPFNAGPRICLGQQFAYHEATFYLIRLLQNFTNFKFDENENLKPPKEWKGADGLQGTDKIVPMVALTMSIKGGLWITMDEFKADEA